MDSVISRFPYIIENLSLYIPDIIGILIGTILFLIFAICIRYIFLYGEAIKILWIEKKQFEKKKHILSDLILMKDIQTELESEIEKAMLKSSFQ